MVLVDELAHATPDRSRQRWEDVAEVFRTANLEALSELARAWMAGTAEAVAEDLLVRRGLAEPPASRVIIAADSGAARGEAVIHRAAELARADDAELLVVHVRIADGLARRPTPDPARRQKLTAELGGTYTTISAHGVVQGLADAARSQGAAVIVVGRHRSRLAELARGSVAARLRRLLPAAAIEEVDKP